VSSCVAKSKEPTRNLRERLVGRAVLSSVLLIPFARKPAASEDPGLYRAMFDQATDARFVLDAHGIILHSNPAACRLFGAAETALYGVPFTELLAPNGRPSYQSSIAAIQKPPARAGPIPLEGRYANGTIIPIEIEIVHGTEERYGVVVRERRPEAPGGPASRGRFNPGQMLIAGRIQELV
jgi:PAS domain S-box-containing protein